MRVVTGTSILSSVLMVFLVVFMKASGAAIALVAGELFSIMLMTRELLRRQKFNVWNCIRGSVIALVVAGSIGFWLRSMPSVPRFAITMLIYLSVIIIAGHFDKNDWIRLKQNLTGFN